MKTCWGYYYYLSEQGDIIEYKPEGSYSTETSSYQPKYNAEYNKFQQMRITNYGHVNTSSYVTNWTKNLEDEYKPKKDFYLLEFLGVFHIIYRAKNNNLYELKHFTLLSIFKGIEFNLLAENIEDEPKCYYSWINNRKRIDYKKDGNHTLKYNTYLNKWYKNNQMNQSFVKMV